MFQLAQLQITSSSEVNVVVAFLAGVVTFFASCLLPLVPVYLAYLSGVSLSLTSAKAKKAPRWEVFRAAWMFVMGFMFTFVILGIAAHRFAGLISTYQIWFQRLAGLLFILFGFQMTGLLKQVALAKSFRLDLTQQGRNHRLVHAFLTGMTFGFSWTPCIGPVLAVILLWASQQATMWLGVTMLIAYSLGIGLPFLLVAVAFERLVPLLKKVGTFSETVVKVMGAILIAIGVLLILNKFQYLVLVPLSLFPHA